MSGRLFLLLIFASLSSPGTATAAAATNAVAQCVVLLHGLARTPHSMDTLAETFSNAGYTVVNVGYPSRDLPIAELAPLAINEGIAGCPDPSTVNFVTHSLGGILLRYYLEQNLLPELGRVVMLAPPNQGSEVVDRMKNLPGYKLLNGPAGMQLGTDQDSVPKQLGPVNFELGVIAGDKTFNLILSLFLPNPDDGKVSVANTRVEGMKDFIVMHHSHTFMTQSAAVAAQALQFIRTGAFSPEQISGQ